MQSPFRDAIGDRRVRKIFGEFPEVRTPAFSRSACSESTGLAVYEDVMCSHLLLTFWRG